MPWRRRWRSNWSIAFRWCMTTCRPWTTTICRRGKPTVHKAFDEATAILAGDALHSHALALLAGEASHPDPLRAHGAGVANWRRRRGRAAWRAASSSTFEGERRRLFRRRNRHDAEDEDRGADPRRGAHGGADRRRRTGRIRGADPLRRGGRTRLPARRRYPRPDATPEQMGKATAQGRARNKPTLVARIGIEAAQRHLGDQIHHALSALCHLRAGSRRIAGHRPLFRGQGEMMKILSVNTGKARAYRQSPSAAPASSRRRGRAGAPSMRLGVGDDDICRSLESMAAPTRRSIFMASRITHFWEAELGAPLPPGLSAKTSRSPGSKARR